MKAMKRTLIAALVAIMAIGANAQQVTTLYFLENAPMRHTINPAFQPVSQGYINFTPLGWMSLSVGNNSLTMSDVLFVDPSTGNTITPLHPNADKQKFLKQLRNMVYFNEDVTLGLLNMGFRIKDPGFLTIGINMRIEGGETMPKSTFGILSPTAFSDLTKVNNLLSLGGMSTGVDIYTEIGGGYSHKIDEHWTVGGKLKVLLGTAHIGLNAKNLNLYTSPDVWQAGGTMSLEVAGPMNLGYVGEWVDGKSAQDIIDGFKGGESSTNQLDMTQLLDIYSGGQVDTRKAIGLAKPSGYGAALDLGFTWKPIEQLQVSLGITDLGFIYWTNSMRFDCNIDSTKVRFDGVGTIDYNDPAFRDANGNFNTQLLSDSVMNNLRSMLTGMNFSNNGKRGFAKMTSARLNVGLDANFWENRIGIGVVSATRLYNSRLYEEVTFGFAFRPCNWFNIAASYSLLNNGKYSNIGAGLGFMPYDGINLTLTMDYIPTSYAKEPSTGKYLIPDKTKMFNLALGFSICWGSNRRDKDKDGVWDKIDMCPDTPRGVQVDSVGCPVDTDKDGVPDYLDHCPGTPLEARGYVDSVGCALDTDGDGVEDYKDMCPNTPEAAYNKIDAKGCPLDTDGDGVPDFIDECPDTPEAAHGKVDEKGCPIDSDGDGVPDYIDECPNTPEAARGYVDAKGCELDSDGDGVEDYKDLCPTVPGVKANKGCPELKREVRMLLQKAMQGIEFETGKATIKGKSFALLDQIAATFIENSNYIIEVQGHTDNTGKEEVNKSLSDKRAHAVMDYLVKKGVDPARMTAIGYGSDKPIEDNKTKAGRAKNRRVEFAITFEEVHIETILDHADPEPVPADSVAAPTSAE